MPSYTPNNNIDVDVEWVEKGRGGGGARILQVQEARLILDLAG